MDEEKKKTALRMIPYGLYVLTCEGADGTVSAATVNWVTQASFKPPLIVVGVKADSLAHTLVKDTGSFALNILGKGQGEIAYGFFKPLEREGNQIGGVEFHSGTTGSPIFGEATAYVECRLVDTVEQGDHSVFVGEVVDAGINKPFEGRADQAVLAMSDLGEKVFYGG
jgi:flavin reductase (DIM6/NTAB) family NADH-FMN oxidoreductase RutF